MRIAFILSRVSNLGPFIVARDIINNIHASVDVIDIFYLKESEEKLKFQASCTKISFLQTIEFSKYDIVHSHGFVADAYVHFHQRKVSGKHITTLHQGIAPDYALKYNPLVGLLFEKIWCHFVKDCSSVVTLTKELATYYNERLKKCEVSFIYNGIEIPPQQEDVPESEKTQILQIKKTHKVIGVSARLIFRKGIDQIIKALSHSKEFALIILGDGEKREELELLAKKMEVNDRCLFLGYKKNAISYFKYFDVYAMTSRSEGFGLCVIEAASQKVPIVCSDLSVYREIFDDEVIRFELENIQSLVQAFDKAIKNKSILSEKVYKKYEKHFTAEIMGSNYLNVYKKISKASISQ